MLRSILVGLDGSEHSDSALELGIRWARRFDALLVGLGVVDEPGLHGPEEYLVGEAYFRGLNKALLADTRRGVEGSLGRAARRCAEAGVAFKELEDVGTPYVQILMEAQRYDLIVLGHHTHFQFGYGDEPDVTLSKVLADSPRPVVAVPDVLGRRRGGGRRLRRQPPGGAGPGRLRGVGPRPGAGGPRRQRRRGQEGRRAPGGAGGRVPAVPWRHRGALAGGLRPARRPR